jgi:hypothetical protein
MGTIPRLVEVELLVEGLLFQVRKKCTSLVRFLAGRQAEA